METIRNVIQLLKLLRLLAIIRQPSRSNGVRLRSVMNRERSVLTSVVTALHFYFRYLEQGSLPLVVCYSTIDTKTWPTSVTLLSKDLKIYGRQRDTGRLLGTWQAISSMPNECVEVFVCSTRSINTLTITNKAGLG